MPSPKRSAAAIAALPIIDLQVETRILAFHTGVDAAQQPPKIGPREVVDELNTDFWNALLLGLI